MTAPSNHNLTALVLQKGADVPVKMRNLLRGKKMDEKEFYYLRHGYLTLGSENPKLSFLVGNRKFGRCFCVDPARKQFELIVLGFFFINLAHRILSVDQPGRVLFFAFDQR